MARLTNRPSLTSSRLHSATPAPQEDQENMDPEAHHREKGKQRAPIPSTTLPTPPSHDELQTDRGHKRKRITVSAPTDEVDEGVQDAEQQFTKHYDPNQDPEARRETKRQLRELERDFLDSREQLMREDGNKKLTETVLEADKIFSQVKQTSDACPDSRLLVSVGELAYKKSAALVTGDDGIGIDVDEFVSRCIWFMRHNGNPQTAEERAAASQRQGASHRDMDDDDDESDATALDWDVLGRLACYPYNSRPPVPSFLLGPLSREKKQRAQTQRRARQAKDNSRESRPEALTHEDLAQSDENSLKAQCEQIRKHLKGHIKTAIRAVQESGVTTENAATQQSKTIMKDYGLFAVDDMPGVPLFQYVINPTSFGQTVENLFYISFLIKEGSAGIGHDDDGLPVLC